MTRLRRRRHVCSPCLNAPGPLTPTGCERRRSAPKQPAHHEPYIIAAIDAVRTAYPGEEEPAVAMTPCPETLSGVGRP